MTRRPRALPFAATVHHTPNADFAASAARRQQGEHSIAVGLDGELGWADARQRAVPAPPPTTSTQPISVFGNASTVRDPLRSALAEFLGRCSQCPPNHATDAVIVALDDDVAQWPATNTAKGPAIVWCSGLQRAAFYTEVETRLPDARFLQGAQGIEALEALLEQQGALTAAASVDVGAQEALQRLRRSYLRALPGELDELLSALPPFGARRDDAFRGFLLRWIGSAGTYGLLAVVASFATGLVDVDFMVLFLLVALALGVAVSMGAVLLEELTYAAYPGWAALGRMLWLAILENLGYRQLTVWWRVRAFWDYVRGNQQWGAMTRKGFAQPGTS